ncbi:hypothetical protein [Corallococcus sp. 4LFB]|uniref:hypothetical protein n=1 Tax=Corallococcus sp. 4LFB TaxID=3383249 RepID=UPI00397542B1
MNRKHVLRCSAVAGFGFFALAGCGGPDAVINAPELGKAEQGITVSTNGSFEHQGDEKHVQDGAERRAVHRPQRPGRGLPVPGRPHRRRRRLGLAALGVAHSRSRSPGH